MQKHGSKMIFSMFLILIFFIFQKGDIEDAHKDKDSKTVFLTCHDIGNNHFSFSVSLMV